MVRENWCCPKTSLVVKFLHSKRSEAILPGYVFVCLFFFSNSFSTGLVSPSLLFLYSQLALKRDRFQLSMFKGFPSYMEFSYSKMTEKSPGVRLLEVTVKRELTIFPKRLNIFMYNAISYPCSSPGESHCVVFLGNASYSNMSLTVLRNL